MNDGILWMLFLEGWKSMNVVWDGGEWEGKDGLDAVLHSILFWFPTVFPQSFHLETNHCS